MFLVDSLTVYVETVRSCVCMVFDFLLLFSLRQLLVSTMYIIIIIIIIIEKKSKLFLRDAKYALPFLKLKFLKVVPIDVKQRFRVKIKQWKITDLD